MFFGIWAAHDVGRVINPRGVEGQIEGGAVQSMGQTIMENYVLSEGVPTNKNFAKYILPTSVDVPEIHSYLVEERDPFSPVGAKGIGEPAPLPTAPAIRECNFMTQLVSGLLHFRRYRRKY